MGDRETITVAEVSEGPGGTGTPGDDVSLPVVEVLTGRGFITGKSGSGKSNTASVVVENLLEASFPVLIVDIDGEYYGLKEKYEILHVGDDEECDIQVSPEHAEKIASLALEDNVPIILDVSSFLDEEEAKELLTAVARQLFAKEKKLKKPFLLLVEEVHEYIPEGGGMDECGKMLIKIGKRGRKHGLGITGISQRPADVKKDFITQCDWLVWHRLTWNNDTKVVGRVLDNEYAEAVEDLGDGEAFLMTDWSETIRRVQFHRKQTFDAGATPGLDDFERPELKSVSEDLVSELESITEQQEAREDRIEELREELDRKNSRIAELEKELQDARDMQRMAEQFTEALLEHVQGTNPGVTEQQKLRDRSPASVGFGPSMQPGPDVSGPDEAAEEVAHDESEADDGRDSEGKATSGEATASDETEAVTTEEGAMEMADAMPDPSGGTDGEAADDGSPEAAAPGDSGSTSGPDGGASADEGAESSPAATDGGDGGTEAFDPETFAAELEDELPDEDFDEGGSGGTDGTSEAADGFAEDDFAAGSGDGFADGTFEPLDDEAEGFPGDGELDAQDVDSGPELDVDAGEELDVDAGEELDVDTGEELDVDAAVDATDLEDIAEDAEGVEIADLSVELTTASDVPAFDNVEQLRREVRSLDRQTQRMLRYYRNQGPGTPMDAHFAAGGSNDRTDAYARNRELRVRGFVEHVGRGRYAYHVPSLVETVVEEGAQEGLELVERVFLSAE